MERPNKEIYWMPDMNNSSYMVDLEAYADHQHEHIKLLNSMYLDKKLLCDMHEKKIQELRKEIKDEQAE